MRYNATRVIVHDDEGGSRMNDRRLEDFARMSESLVKNSLRNDFEFDEAKASVKQGDGEHFAIVATHVGKMFIFYTGRFLFFAPKRLECSDTGLKLEFRNGKSAQIARAEVSGASFTRVYGLRWKFRTASSTLRLGGDGFSGMEWFRISRLILEKLVARQIEVSTDSAGRDFLS
jgi:hypothetical protein